jgi:hypothetical protein
MTLRSSRGGGSRPVRRGSNLAAITSIAQLKRRATARRGTVTNAKNDSGSRTGGTGGSAGAGQQLAYGTHIKRGVRVEVRAMAVKSGWVQQAIHLLNQPTNRTTDQPTNQPLNRPANLPTT